MSLVPCLLTLVPNGRSTSPCQAQAAVEGAIFGSLAPSTIMFSPVPSPIVSAVCSALLPCFVPLASISWAAPPVFLKPILLHDYVDHSASPPTGRIWRRRESERHYVAPTWARSSRITELIATPAAARKSIRSKPGLGDPRSYSFTYAAQPMKLGHLWATSL